MKIKSINSGSVLMYILVLKDESIVSKIRKSRVEYKYMVKFLFKHFYYSFFLIYSAAKRLDTSVESHYENCKLKSPLASTKNVSVLS